MTDIAGEIRGSTEFDPMVEPHRENPFEFFSWAREHEPVTYVPALGAWLVSRYEDCVRVLGDTGTFSSQNSLGRVERDNPPEVLEILSRAIPIPPTVVHYDPPEHAPHRAVWRRILRGARISALQPRLREIAEELVADFAGAGHVELVEQFARPFVLRSLCAVVGLPDGDHDRAAVGDLSFLTLLVPTESLEAKKQAAEAWIEFDEYLLDLFEQRRNQPADDMLTELVELVDDPDDPFSLGDALITIRSVFAAGTHTPTNTISATVWSTLSHREHWERMSANPTSAVPAAIEETLRRDAPHRGLMRVTTREVELSGVVLPAGATVFPMLGSANRDGGHFEDPDAFCPGRSNARSHVAFGYGPHDCVGKLLARTMARIAVTALLRHFPALQLAPESTPTHDPDWFFWSLSRLDVTWAE